MGGLLGGGGGGGAKGMLDPSKIIEGSAPPPPGPPSSYAYVVITLSVLLSVMILCLPNMRYFHETWYKYKTSSDGVQRISALPPTTSVL